MENATPLVSVIIPNFNRTVELERALKSALSQTYENLEIIVVDDNSLNAEEIHAVVNSFDDLRIKCYFHDVNKGGGASRNTGIENATGDYVAFLDSDDEWMSDKIESQLRTLNYTCCDNVLIFCKSKIIYRSTPMFLPLRGIKHNERMCDYLFVNGGFLQTSSILVSTNLARQIMFNPSLRRHQDYDFLLRVGSTSPKYIYIDKSLVTIHWEGNRGYLTKGWRPTLSENFALEYSEYFSKKAFNNFLFMYVINSSAVCYSKFYSLKKILSINIFYVKPINMLKYLKNLLRFNYEK